MSRTPHMDENLYQSIVEDLRKDDFPVDKLRRTEQWSLYQHLIPYLLPFHHKYYPNSYKNFKYIRKRSVVLTLFNLLQGSVLINSLNQLNPTLNFIHELNISNEVNLFIMNYPQYFTFEDVTTLDTHYFDDFTLCLLSRITIEIPILELSIFDCLILALYIIHFYLFICAWDLSFLQKNKFAFIEEKPFFFQDQTFHISSLNVVDLFDFIR